MAELILILLRDFLGIEEYGPFEKMRWGLTFDYSGVPFAFELRKFGLALISPREHPLESALTQELVGKLKKAIVLVERHLSEIAERQTAEGNVTILNLFGRLDARYRFFREQAAEAYVQQESRPDGWESASPSWSPARDLTARAGHFLKYGRAAFHFTGAMIDAYFSRTEHLFILLLPFLDFDPGEGQLLAFLDRQWGDKMKVVLDINVPRTKAVYDRMLRLRDQVRNPLAHGGIERDGGSLQFHFPGVGALPARLTRQREGVPHLSFVPFPQTRYADCCQLFDELDAILRDPPTHFGTRWAESGLNIAFDADTRAEYAQAMESEEQFEELLRKTSYLNDYHTNMEY